MFLATTDAIITELGPNWNSCIQEARISLDLDENKPVEELIKSSFYCRFLKISTRSRLAQMGFEIQKHNSNPYFEITGRKAELDVLITSCDGSKVALKPGDKVCRFYINNDTMLRKTELEELAKTKAVDLGPDSRIYNNLGVVELHPKKMKLKLRKDLKLPLSLEQMDNLDSLLETEEVDEMLVSPGEFVLAETYPIKLPPHCYAELMIASQRGEVAHLWSPLIDLGFSRRIRLEFYNYQPQPVKPIAYMYVFSAKQ